MLASNAQSPINDFRELIGTAISPRFTQPIGLFGGFLRKSRLALLSTDCTICQITIPIQHTNNWPIILEITCQKAG